MTGKSQSAEETHELVRRAYGKAIGVDMTDEMLALARMPTGPR